jgi:hypothetical protein
MRKKQIMKIPKKTMGVITISYIYSEHSVPFLKFNILPYDIIILQGKLQFMHSVEYGYVPSSFRNVWINKTDRHHNHDQLYMTSITYLYLD